MTGAWWVLLAVALAAPSDGDAVLPPVQPRLPWVFGIPGVHLQADFQRTLRRQLPDGRWYEDRVLRREVGWCGEDDDEEHHCVMNLSKGSATTLIDGMPALTDPRVALLANMPAPFGLVTTVDVEHPLELQPGLLHEVLAALGSRSGLAPVHPLVPNDLAGLLGGSMLVLETLSLVFVELPGRRLGERFSVHDFSTTLTPFDVGGWTQWLDVEVLDWTPCHEGARVPACVAIDVTIRWREPSVGPADRWWNEELARVSSRLPLIEQIARVLPSYRTTGRLVLDPKAGTPARWTGSTRITLDEAREVVVWEEEIDVRWTLREAQEVAP